MAFAIVAGVLYRRARRGYDQAVDVYNDSLGLRLGLYDAEGQYRPPPGVLVDEEGFIILDQRELLIPGNAPTTTPEPEPVVPPAPIEPQPFEGNAPAPAAPSASTSASVGLVGPARVRVVP